MRVVPKAASVLSRNLFLAAREGRDFPRAARLLRPAEFSALRRTGRRIPGRQFQCEVVLNRQAMARLGLAISRRVSKKAVVRNRIKRIVRESFRAVRDQLPHVDILIMARQSAAEQNNALLRQELTRLWETLQSLKLDPNTGTIGRF